METTRNETEISPIPTKRNRCRLLIAVLCIAVSTVVFFGSVTAIVWLFEHNMSYRYSVVCFMAGSGMLYVVAFTSSLLLLTGELPKRSMSKSREPNVGVIDSVQNEVGSATETVSDISYRGGAQLLQLPQRVTPIKTPPPPYKEPSETSTAQNDTNQVQSTRDSNNADNFPYRFYYELNRDESQGTLVGRQEHTAFGFDMEMQTVVKSHSTNGSLNHSKPITNALKQQMASNSSLLSASSFEHSSGSTLEVMRNPSQGVKRKMKAAPMSMSHPDLHSAESQNRQSNLNHEGKASRSDYNADTRSLQYNFNPHGTPKILRSNVEGRTSQSILNPQGTPKVPRSEADTGTSLLNLNLPGTPKIPRSNAEVQSNLNPQATPRIQRPNTEVRTSQSNLSIDVRQASRSDLSEETNSSLTDLKPEGTTRFSRSNLLRTSQMHLIPEAALETSPSSFSVDQKCKLESLSLERRQLDSKSNYLVPTDRQFTSHFNLHHSNSNSYVLQHAPQVVTNSSASLNTSRSNTTGEYLKQISQPLTPFQKLSQPHQFVAYSENLPKLPKAQSFTTLPVTNPLRVSMEAVPERTCMRQFPNSSSNRQMSGRSIESVLDATRSKQMTPEEWMKAWNRGFHKLPNEAEKVVGVRI